MKYHYVYITTNMINGKQYVGDRSCKCEPLNDSYLGSGRPLFENAKKKYGKENFKKEILEFFETKKEAFNAQEKYIKMYNTLNPNGYNISPKGGLNVNGCHSEETKNKIGNANKIKRKGRKASKETINKMRLSMLGKNKGKKLSQEQKNFLSNLYKNKTYEELYGKEKAYRMIENSRNSHKGFKHSEKSKEIMREKALGRCLSDVTKEKIRNTLTGKKQKTRKCNLCGKEISVQNFTRHYKKCNSYD